jgi:hypothetical protein
MLFFKFSIAVLLAPLAVSAGPVRRGGNMMERQDFFTDFDFVKPTPVVEPTSMPSTDPTSCDPIDGTCI